MLGEELNFNDREVVLRADLSALDELDCVWTPTRFLMGGPRMPMPGERVVLVDVNGAGTCLGRVVSVTGWEACVRPDWETWSGADDAVCRPGSHAAATVVRPRSHRGALATGPVPDQPGTLATTGSHLRARTRPGA